MKTTLDHKKGFLCVLTESEISDGLLIPTRQWHPVHPAERRRSGRWWDARSPKPIPIKAFT